MPRDAALQPPHDPRAVGPDAAVHRARSLGRQHRHDRAIGIDVGKRLVEELRRFEVLRGHGQVRIEHRRRRPVQHAHLASTAATHRRRRRRWSGLGLGVRHAGAAQQRARHRSRQPDPDHRPDEASPGEPSGFDVGDEFSNHVLVHRNPPARDRSERRFRSSLSPAAGDRANRSDDRRGDRDDAPHRPFRQAPHLAKRHGEAGEDDHGSGRDEPGVRAPRPRPAARWQCVGLSQGSVGSAASPCEHQGRQFRVV